MSALKSKPKIIGFTCNWCCYAGADLAGVSRYQYPTYIRIIRVMCSGRIDPEFIFRAFLNGADGVFVGGCWLGECHYATEGNYHAISMVYLCKRILEYIGINPERLRLEWVNASEGIRFAEIMRDFSQKVEGLGSLGTSEGMEIDELKVKLEEVRKLIPYIKLMKKDKLSLRLKDEEYRKLYTREEIEQLFSEVVSYYIDPEKCQACGICRRNCPVEAISGAKNQIHVIDQEKCIKCGTCFNSCPPRFNAVRRIVAEPVPPPIPEEERTIMREK